MQSWRHRRFPPPRKSQLTAQTLAPIGLLALTGLLVLVAVVLLTPGLHEVADLLWLKLQVLLGIDA